MAAKKNKKRKALKIKVSIIPISNNFSIVVFLFLFFVKRVIINPKSIGSPNRPKIENALILKIKNKVNAENTIFKNCFLSIKIINI